MGRTIEKILKKELLNHQSISKFILSFEYREYEDEENKVISRFFKEFNCFLMLDDKNTITSKRCFLFDLKDRKLFCCQLHPDSKVSSLTTHIVIESMLQNITFIGNTFKTIYKDDIDNVPVFPLTILSPEAQQQALLNWMPSVALRHNIGIHQCHEVTLVHTMSLDAIEKMNIPDYQIIRSQLGDITLIKKF